MAVAIRKRCLEDHITSRSGLHYSYDDLDLVCCRPIVGTNDRVRCVSMPECGHHRHLFDLSSLQGDVREDATWIGVPNFKNKAATHNGNKIIGNERNQDGVPPCLTIQEEYQGSVLGNVKACDEVSNKKLNEDKVQHHQASTAQMKNKNDLSNLSGDDILKVNCSELHTCSTGRSSEESLENAKSIVTNTVGVPPPEDVSAILNVNNHPTAAQQRAEDSQHGVQAQFCETSEQISFTNGKVETLNTDRIMIPDCPAAILPITVETTYSEAPDANFIVTRSKMTQDQEDCENQKFRMSKDGGYAKLSTLSSQEQGGCLEIWQDCSPKLHTIPESGDDVLVLTPGDMRESHQCRDFTNGTICVGLTAELGTSPSENNSRQDNPEPREDQPEVNTVKQKPNEDDAVKDTEIVLKPEASFVKLRSKKSLQEEKEEKPSRLDSMVLLIMKLDQLDQEIENALSSSLTATPNLKRRIISDVSLEMFDSPESLSASSQSLNTPVYRSFSSLSSSGPPGTSGARPKSEISSLHLEESPAEIEAKEACTWLRAAGFPQYAQLYEDAQFPINISAVTRDHDFLDQDAIEALCRRLNTLNKCALMRLEITPQRKRSEDSDEDEPCAISGRWTFQRDSKRWSRMDQLDLEVFSPQDGDPSQDERFTRGPLLKEGVNASAESVLTDLSEQPEVGSLHSASSGSRVGSLSTTVPSSPAAISNINTATTTRASSIASVCSSGTSGANEDSLSEGLPSPLERGTFAFDVKPSLKTSGAEKSTRSRAKSFLKRMESLRLRSSSNASTKRKKKTGTGQGRLEISGPVLKEGLDDDKLRALNCVDITTLDHNANRSRSISYSTQTSSGSAGSSQSEASSGSAVSTPSPVSRARSHSSTAGSIKRAGMYLEGFDPFSFVVLQPAEVKEDAPTHNKQTEPSTTAENNRRNRSTNRRQEEEETRDVDGGLIFFYLPEGHKPGTFPKALADGGSLNSTILRPPRRDSATSLDSRLSFYDNVPFSEMRDDEEYSEEPKLQDVLERVSGLQRLVNAWSETGTGEEEEDDEEEEGDSDSALDSASPCPSSPLQNRLEETENGSDQDSTGNPMTERDESLSGRERCDSGVGASLSRVSRPQKLRWPSFQSSHRPSLSSSVLQVGCQSVLQMNLLQKYSLLKLTALLERYTPTNKHGFSWAVPKFMKRIKVRDYKERNVFGVPLQVIVQRSGQPLPQSIQQAMRYLRSQCLDQVGLFRKSGVKSRIQALRQMNESCGIGGVNYEGQSAYDVADMLKQYFRDLPEPLLTSKLSDTFLQIYQYVPKEQRLQAVRAAVLLLPDENREALQTLLCFLSDVTANVGENQMTCTNLAVCLAPSLFHLNTLRRESSSPRVMNRKNTLGKPDQRDLNENLAATHGLAHMIQECRKLFLIPEEMSCCRNSYMEQSLSPVEMEVLAENCSTASYRSLLKDSLDALLKEAKDKFKGYDSCSTPESADLAYKKVQDGSSLRQWKVCVEVPASAEEVMQRILREQERWDEDLLESRTVETLEQNVEVYQYVKNSMAPHPPRDHVVLRSWVTDLPKGVSALVCVSVDHESAGALGVRANVLTSRYYIEPCGTNKSRLTHISRTDCRGRCPEWYNKLFGHLCAAEVVRIRDSFTCLDK